MAQETSKVISSQTHSPLFMFFYDPPSPEVPSEYDPPFPSDAIPTESTISGPLATRVSSVNRVPIRGDECKSRHEGKYSKMTSNQDAEPPTVGMSEFNIKRGQEVGHDVRNKSSEILPLHSSSYGETKEGCEEMVDSFPRYDSSSHVIALTKGKNEDKNQTKSSHCASGLFEDVMLLLSNSYSGDSGIQSSKPTTLFEPNSNRSDSFKYCLNDSTVPAHEGLATEEQRSTNPPTASSPLNHQLEAASTRSDKFSNEESPHNYIAPCLGNQAIKEMYEKVSPPCRESINLVTENHNIPTITKLMTSENRIINSLSLDPSNTKNTTQGNARSSLTSNNILESDLCLQPFMKDGETLQTGSDNDRTSCLRSPSPSFSSLLTESCSITPFPTNFTTPYSTNPTCTPLPSPIPSEVLSNLTSESSPSTSSTVTSSAMFCLSKKLENLSQSLASTSCNSTTCEENYSKRNSSSNIDSEGKQAVIELTEKLSPFGDDSVNLGTDNINPSSKRKGMTRESRIINSTLMIAKYNEPQNENSLEEILTSIETNHIPNINEKDGNIESQLSLQYRPNREVNNKDERQPCYSDSTGRDDNLNVIFCSSPVMKRSEVTKSEGVFMQTSELTKSQNAQISQFNQETTEKPEVMKNSCQRRKKYDRGENNALLSTKINEHQFIHGPKLSTRNPDPPIPPPRMNSSYKDVLPPPIPPPPIEDDINEENDLPPIPELPTRTEYFWTEPISVAPAPPVRHYLLVPLIPGKATPVLLTPPLTPQRSSSYRNPLPSPPPRPSSPSFSPAPAPPPRIIPLRPCKGITNSHEGNETKESERERPSLNHVTNGLYSESDLVLAKNGTGSRYTLSLVRELTPVPEEKTSSASHSPTPDREGEASTYDPVSVTHKEVKQMQNGVSVSSVYDPKIIINLPPPFLDASFESRIPDCEDSVRSPMLSTNHNCHSNASSEDVLLKNDTALCSPTLLTEHSPPPPPLPPRQKVFKISPSLKPSPPPLPVTPPPPPPKLSSESLSGTRVPPQGASPSEVVVAGLSPCRLKERSPPNDRDFLLFPLDKGTSEEPKRRPSSTCSSDQLPTAEIPCPPATFPPKPDGELKSSCMILSPYGRLVIDRSDLPLPAPEEEIRKVYAAVKRWGWINAYKDTLAIYTQFRPIIQKGPQCGLVAVSMASQSCQKLITVDELLETARGKGISGHGEMFNADAMADLATAMLKGMSACVRRNVLESPAEVVRILLEGDFILFPYDSEPNHFPGLHGGMKSHWGLLCGCLVQSSGLGILRTQDFPFLRPDLQDAHLWHIRPLTRSLDKDQRPSSVPLTRFPDVKYGGNRSASPRCAMEEEGPTPVEEAKRRLPSAMPCGEFSKWEWCKDDRISSLVVLYRQGKSRNLIYCPLADLSKSNSQLYEYPPTEGYVIGNVEEGLSKQVVILHKNNPGLSDLVTLMQQKEAKF